MMVVSVASTVIFIYRFPVIRVTASSVMLRKLYDIEKSQKKKQNTLLIYYFFFDKYNHGHDAFLVCFFVCFCVWNSKWITVNASFNRMLKEANDIGKNCDILIKISCIVFFI